MRGLDGFNIWSVVSGGNWVANCRQDKEPVLRVSMVTIETYSNGKCFKKVYTYVMFSKVNQRQTSILFYFSITFLHQSSRTAITKFPQIVWFKQQKLIFFQFQRLEVQDKVSASLFSAEAPSLVRGWRLLLTFLLRPFSVLMRPSVSAGCLYFVYLLRHERWGFSSWVGKIPWSRKWQPLQYSCLEDSMYRGTWQAAVHGVTKCQTQLSD